MTKLKSLLLVLLLFPIVSNAEITVEDFFKYRQADSLKLSPDGRYLAVRGEVSGKREVYILDRKTKEIKQRFFFPQDYEAGTFYWVSDKRLVVGRNKKVGPLDLPAQTGYYFGGDVDGSDKYQIWPPRNKAGASTSLPKGFRVVDTLDSDEDTVLTVMYERGYPGLYEFDVYSSRYRKIDTGAVKGGSILIGGDNKAYVSIGVDEDNQDLILLYLKNSEGSWEKFAEFEREDGMISPLQVYDNDSKLMVFSDVEEGKAGIYSIDLKTKEKAPLHILKGDASVEDYIYEFSYNSPKIVGVERQPNYPESTFFDKDSKVYAIQSTLESAFPDKVVDISRPTRDNRFAIVRVSNDQDAGSFYLFDAKTNKLSFEMKSFPWIDADQLGLRHPVSFKARDGLEIRGYLTLPKGKEKNLPMVVLVHGGPYGVYDRWYYDSEAQFYAYNGYAVLQVNYRGSGGRGRNFEFPYYQQMGREMQDDLTDATLWAIDKGIADKDRVCIAGASYGAYAALMGVVKEPDLYQCAIGYAGAYDIEVFKYSDIYERESGREFLNEAWGYDNAEFAYERSPVNFVDKIKANLLLIHGTGDRRTPIEHYEVLTEKLEESNIAYESLVKPNEGHGFADEDNRIEAYTKMLEFLNSNLKK
ncbi:alpha/beta hydrolase family protein [Kangiella sediminilitoris]|uniref:Peptidase S9 prolyl oligopeptidase catalytic domain-containing protein n=1 Tax=Kangiella sediminilitoris TaxID=1144748 RepID=A0A1B3BAD0_9GAMM|nr:alpha/beta fold hydrolase [Kangiella sediminilitoris]AOE49755.1 hypothetical protein KS2013_1035 [Kangiella sediminilitoris]